MVWVSQIFIILNCEFNAATIIFGIKHTLLQGNYGIKMIVTIKMGWVNLFVNFHKHWYIKLNWRRRHSLVIVIYQFKYLSQYHFLLGISLKIVQLLQHFEHLVQPLAQAVQTFVDEFSIKGVVSEVIRWGGTSMAFPWVMFKMLHFT